MLALLTVHAAGVSPSGKYGFSRCGTERENAAPIKLYIEQAAPLRAGPGFTKRAYNVLDAAEHE